MNSEAYEAAFGRYHNEEVRKLKPGHVLWWVDDNQDGGLLFAIFISCCTV